MELFSGRDHGDLLDDNLATASFDGKVWSNPRHKGGRAAGIHQMATIKTRGAQDDGASEHPLVPTNAPIYGYVYDVKIGRFNEVKTGPKRAKSQQLEGEATIRVPRPKGGRLSHSRQASAK